MPSGADSDVTNLILCQAAGSAVAGQTLEQVSAFNHSSVLLDEEGMVTPGILQLRHSRIIQTEWLYLFSLKKKK